jgi:hypothetical protein
MRTLLAHRDYRGYTGGHGKFLDYLAHVQAHPAWQVRLHLSPASPDADNPFLHLPMEADWRPAQADALLLGGMDWSMLEGEAMRASQPIINLVQHVRHADEGSTLRSFLSRHAIRVCVSSAVADAILATGEVAGPVHVIPAAVDLAMLTDIGARTPMRHGVFIDAVKQTALGREVAERLRVADVAVDLLTERLPRFEYLRRMAAADVVVTLPDRVEGFYLPGLEAMAMGRALVQYDCVGSRDYLDAERNALVPAVAAESVAAAALRLHADAALRTRISHAGQATAQRFNLETERRQVHALLDAMDELWRN